MSTGQLEKIGEQLERPSAQLGGGTALYSRVAALREAGWSCADINLTQPDWTINTAIESVTISRLSSLKCTGSNKSKLREVEDWKWESGLKSFCEKFLYILFVYFFIKRSKPL